MSGIYNPGSSSGGGVVAGGRLSLSSTDPLPTTDQAAKTVLYYLAYSGESVSLWDGSAYSSKSIGSGLSVTPTLAASKVYDVFGYISGGAAAIELGPAWTNVTTRATDVVYHSNYGIRVKSGDVTRRWLGVVATDSSSKLNDTAGSMVDFSGSGSVVSAYRTVVNAHNQVRRPFRVGDAFNGHTYSTSSWRNWNNVATEVHFVNPTGKDYVLTCAASYAVSMGDDGLGVMKGGTYVGAAIDGEGLGTNDYLQYARGGMESAYYFFGITASTDGLFYNETEISFSETSYLLVGASPRSLLGKHYIALAEFGYFAADYQTFAVLHGHVLA